MAALTPISHFQSLLLDKKIQKAISPDYRQGSNPDYDFYLCVKLKLIEDIRKLMSQSVKFYSPYDAILTNENTFFELWDMDISDMEILLYGLNKELRESRCYDGC